MVSGAGRMQTYIHAAYHQGAILTATQPAVIIFYDLECKGQPVCYQQGPFVRTAVILAMTSSIPKTNMTIT